MSKPVVVFGLGDYSRVACFVLEDEGGREVAAFTVHAQYASADVLMERPIVPFEQVAERFPPAEFDMLIATGFGGVNEVRADVCRQARALGYELVTHVSPRATVASNAVIGDNCFIFENNVIQPFVTIGDNVVLWSGNHVGHDSTIEDDCFIASHVVISGNVTVGRATFIGVNATLRDGITVGEKNVIGAGALVMKDTEPGAVLSVRGTQPIERKSWELGL